MPGGATNVPAYSVSDISGALKRLVEDHFGRVRVRGEISGYKVHTSGHAYYTLKDAQAVLDAVSWRANVAKFKFKVEDGLEVVAVGRLTTYPGRSKYQLIVESMEPAGAGALMALLEKRKAALAAEGLFAPERKKPLPFLPSIIGVVTSPSGAVLRDILHRISERFPCRVIVWPVQVQGEGAAEQVAAAINGFQNFQPRPDVIIVARGGGSIEDLWAFNEEIVVRAAAASRIPLISAVGHETDTTLIDFVSDRRAPTPTAAAELATPVLAELRLGLRELGARQMAAVLRIFDQQRERVEGLRRALPRPETLLEHATQRLDDWAERLAAAPAALLDKKSQVLQGFASLLRPQLLLKDAAQMQQRLQEWRARMQQAALRRTDDKQRALDGLAALMASLSYQNVLKRGFALVRSAQGELLTSAKAVAKEEQVTLVLQDGEVAVKPSN